MEKSTDMLHIVATKREGLRTGEEEVCVLLFVPCRWVFISGRKESKDVT